MPNLAPSSFDSDTAWDKGYDASAYGLPATDCPFEEGSDHALEWLDGFNAHKVSVMTTTPFEPTPNILNT